MSIDQEKNLVGKISISDQNNKSINERFFSYFLVRKIHVQNRISPIGLKNTYKNKNICNCFCSLPSPLFLRNLYSAKYP